MRYLIICFCLILSVQAQPPEIPKIKPRLLSPKDTQFRLSYAPPIQYRTFFLAWDWKPEYQYQWTNVKFELQQRPQLIGGSNWLQYAVVYTNKAQMFPTGSAGAFRVRAGWRNTNLWSEWNSK